MKKMRNVKQDVEKMMKQRKHLDEEFMGKKLYEEDETIKVANIIKDNLVLFETLDEVDKNFISRLGDKSLLQFMSAFGVMSNIKLVKYFTKEIKIRDAIAFGKSYNLIPECYNIYFNPFTIIMTLIEELKYGNIYVINNNLYGTLESFPIAKYNVYEWGNLKLDKKVKKIAAISLNENEDIYAVDRKSAFKFLVPKVVKF